MFSLQKQFKRPKGILGWLAGKTMEFDNRKINNWSIKQLSIQEGDKILEIGYGPGYCINQIHRQFNDVKIDGVDISETMMETAHHKNQKAIDEGMVCLYKQDISQFKLKEEVYDKIFSVNNYPLWENQESALTHLFHMLLKGGTLLITVQPRGEEETDQNARRYGETISKALQKAGFHDITITFKKVRPSLTVCVKCIK